MQPTVNLENTAFFVGLPDEANKAKIDKQHEKGGKIIWILRPDDARKFSCPYGDLACEWRNDIDLQSFLFEHIAKNNGGEIMGSSEAAVVQALGEAVPDLVVDAAGAGFHRLAHLGGEGLARHFGPGGGDDRDRGVDLS